MVAMTATNFAVRTQPGLELPFRDGAEAGILCLFASSMSGIRWVCFAGKTSRSCKCGGVGGRKVSDADECYCRELASSKRIAMCQPCECSNTRNGTVCWAQCDKRQRSYSAL